MCACDAVCVFVFPVCTCIEISVVLSYYVLRCHYIIELAGEREWGVGAVGCARQTAHGRDSGWPRVVVAEWVNVRDSGVCGVYCQAHHLIIHRLR